jgi:putative spermidine/putrescine transport system ATP-binding protein
MASVTLTSITKTYGPFRAIDDFSLEVFDGEFLVLLGPSGCGKTTTLRTIAGFVDATAGRIAIGARDVTGEPPYRRNIGLVFQNYALFPHLTVFENVAFGLRRRGVEEGGLKQRVVQALELVKMAELSTRLPKELSGGQQQRVAIARAIAIEPDILLLDEPLSNLDAKLRHDVRQELKRLQRELGITTIMVTHDQDEAMSVGDRLVVMNQGRIQQVGDPESIYRSPANKFVASFIGQANFLPGKAKGDGQTFVTEGGLHFPCENAVSEADLLMVRPEAIRISSADEPESHEATVENVVFLGSHYELFLSLADGNPLAARMPQSAAGSNELEPGRKVFISVSPKSAVGIRGN